MKRRLWIGVLAALALLFIIGTGSADTFPNNLTINATDSATVSVNLSSRVMIDITPAALAWHDVAPGGEGNRSHEVHNFYAIQIENIGSRNISYVWFNASFPSSSPFGVGGTTNTNSGNYIALSPNESSDEFWFVNRVEFNATRSLVYLTDPDGNMPPDASKFLYGRFHNTSNEYFWMTDNASACNHSSYIRIGNTAHTKEATGSVEFDNPAEYTQFNLTSWENYAYGDINSGPLGGYCAAVKSDGKVFFSRWNKDAPFHLCNNNEYAWNSTARGENLVPGDSFAMKIKAFVPYGIYEGSSNPGTLTVIVNEVGL